MSLRMVWVHVAAILLSLRAGAVACVVPIAPVVPPGPTEVDRAYYYSTIGQELAYVRLLGEAGVAAPTDLVRPVGPKVRNPLAPRLGAECSALEIVPASMLCPAPLRPIPPLRPRGLDGR